jgi:hypothetical protein
MTLSASHTSHDASRLDRHGGKAIPAGDRQSAQYRGCADAQPQGVLAEGHNQQPIGAGGGPMSRIAVRVGY